MSSDLLQAVEASDVAGAAEEFREGLQGGTDPWEMHLSLFPAVQGVLNPPFINPHLPKMYRICREFVPYLEKEEIAPLVQLEVNEYARRPRRPQLTKTGPIASPVSFRDIESAIGEQDWKKTADLMAVFYEREGEAELARQLLLLGSGYLQHSLGHAVSCTAFILLEMMQRKDQDPWPALVTVADFFCKGRFYIPSAWERSREPLPERALEQSLLKATSGLGIVNLHHTITLYAIERVCHLFTREEYNHMIGAWIEFMGEKRAEPMDLGTPEAEKTSGDRRFYESFFRLEAKPVARYAMEMIDSAEGRQQLGRFLVKGLCDLYRGDYNPHYLTGLASTLWVVNQYWKQPSIATQALFQYLSFFFDGLKNPD